jgi:hypothetical protein
LFDNVKAIRDSFGDCGYNATVLIDRSFVSSKQFLNDIDDWSFVSGFVTAPSTNPLPK